MSFQQPYGKVPPKKINIKAGKIILNRSGWLKYSPAGMGSQKIFLDMTVLKKIRATITIAALIEDQDEDRLSA